MSSEETTPDRSDARFAGLDRRLAAYAVDIVILYAVILSVQTGLNSLSGGWLARNLTTGARIESWVLLTVSGPTWLYFVLSEQSTRGATLGKQLLRLRVTDQEGGRIGFGRAILRTAVKLLPWELTHLTILTPVPWFQDPTPGFRPGLVVVYALLGVYMLSLIFSPRKQGPHDLLAGTLVVHTESIS